MSKNTVKTKSKPKPKGKAKTLPITRAVTEAVGRAVEATKAKPRKKRAKEQPKLSPPEPPAFLARVKLTGLPDAIDADGWIGLRKALHEAHRYAAAQAYVASLARYSRNGNDPERKAEAANDVKKSTTATVKQVFGL